MPLDLPEYRNIPTYKNTIKLLQQEPEIIDLLERIIQWEEEMPSKSPEYYELGFRAEEVFGDPRTVAKLVPRGILRLSYKSSSDTRYRALNLGELKRAVQDWRAGQEVREEEPSQIPDDLFKYIVGHEDVKEILWRAIRSEAPVHVLLTGVPSSAKSLFLEDLMRLPKSAFVLGSGLSDLAERGHLGGRPRVQGHAEPLRGEGPLGGGEEEGPDLGRGTGAHPPQPAHELLPCWRGHEEGPR